MGGLHDCGLVEDIKMVFFNEEGFVDKISMVHRFIEKIVSRNKTREFEFTELCHYSIEYVNARKDRKTIWGDTFRINWKLNHNAWPSSTILAVRMKLSTGGTPNSWFEVHGGAAFVGNPEQSKLSLGDVAKMSGCALDITCKFSYSGPPTSSQREIYMPDGNKVFSEKTKWDSDGDWNYEMENPDFGKTSFISIIEDNRFEEELMHLTLNGEVQDEEQQS